MNLCTRILCLLFINSVLNSDGFCSDLSSATELTPLNQSGPARLSMNDSEINSRAYQIGATAGSALAHIRYSCPEERQDRQHPLHNVIDGGVDKCHSLGANVSLLCCGEVVGGLVVILTCGTLPGCFQCLPGWTLMNLKYVALVCGTCSIPPSYFIAAPWILSKAENLGRLLRRLKCATCAAGFDAGFFIKKEQLIADYSAAETSE